MPLVRGESARVLRKEQMEMIESLVQRIGLCTGRRRPFATQKTSHRIKPASQPPNNAVGCLQRKRKGERFGGGSDRLTGKQGTQQRPQQRSRERVARQHVRDEQGEGFPTADALPAIRAKHPLASSERTVHHRRIVAAQHAVAVERAAASAMRTAVLLERKNTALNASASSTKPTRVENIGPSSCQTDPGTSEPFQNGTALQPTGLGSKGEAI